jgi:aerobic carbon-monoxide dehydrogenase medium subunit
MAKVIAYHRPHSIGDALALLHRPGATVLAGGTTVNADQSVAVIEAVDIQALGLGAITRDERDWLRLGATATLQDIADSTLVPPLLAELARRELPSTLRTIATVGGTVADADAESAFLAGLLAFGAAVSVIGTDGVTDHTLTDVLGDRALVAQRIITHVTIDTDGATAFEHTERTPMDTAIVAVVGRRSADDDRVTIAASGVSSTPVLIEAGTDLTPPGDFRGTTAYRTHLANTLLARVRATLGVQS